MNKIITSFLVLVLSFSLMGCSKTTAMTGQYSSSSLKLNQEYTKTFSPSFANEAESITKISIDLYNKGIIDKAPEKDTFISNYEDFDKVVPKNADEKDFQDSVHKFALYYSMLALDVSILVTEQDLRNRGIESKDKYDAKMLKYTNSKSGNIEHIKIDIENIMKYYK